VPELQIKVLLVVLAQVAEVIKRQVEVVVLLKSEKPPYLP
jgi:hypothetical protein